MKALHGKAQPTDKDILIRLNQSGQNDLESIRGMIAQMFDLKASNKAIVQRSLSCYLSHLMAGIIEAKMETGKRGRMKIGADQTRFEEFLEAELRDLYLTAGKEMPND